MSDTIPSSGDANRRSYFREASMEEYTPANSINEASVRERRPGHLWRWVNGPGKLVLRMANAVLHLGLCAVLFVIMIKFMVQYKGRSRRPQAIALISLVAIDACLDFYALLSLKRKWPGWAMALCLLLAMGYITQFLLYVGYRKVFPRNYAFWGMAAEYSDPVVYVLLLVLGVWNLLHTAIHRHALGRDLRRLVVCIQNHYRHSRQVDHGNRSSQRQSPSDGRLATTSTPTRVEAVSSLPEPIALSEVRADDKGPGMVFIDQIGTSSTSGESSSHGESVVHTKSETVSAVTSRRTSTTVSDEEASNVDGRADNSAVRKL